MSDPPALVPLARVADIPPEGMVAAYRDGPFEESAILLRSGETVRAFKNRCRHLAVRLDARQPGRLVDRQGNLVCQEHGATYRPADGLCTAGPCAGSRLRALPVVVVDGVVLLDTGAASSFLALLGEST